MFTVLVTENEGGGWLEIDIATTSCRELAPMAVLDAIANQVPEAQYAEASGLMVSALQDFNRILTGVREGFIARPLGWPTFQKYHHDLKGTVNILEHERVIP
jgi:hypothetical protein